jgi:hypothetical protein
LADSYDYICAAYPGIGNREISARVKDAVGRSTADIVIVCWTWPSRDGSIDSSDSIIEVQELLKLNKIEYIFTCADNCIRTNNDAIDWDRWFWFPAAHPTEIYNTHTPRGFYQWAVENKYPVGIDHHPLLEAHRDAAALMQGKFNELVKTIGKSN